LTSSDVRYQGLEQALRPYTQIRLFGKPDIGGRRRMGVALATADNTDAAVQLAKTTASAVKVSG
jgi:phosphoribosylglycinamide formyltransferase 2